MPRVSHNSASFESEVLPSECYIITEDTASDSNGNLIYLVGYYGLGYEVLNYLWMEIFRDHIRLVSMYNHVQNEHKIAYIIVMDTRDLPDMYAKYISGKSRMHMLQVLCNTPIAIVTIPVGWMPQAFVCGIISSTNC